MTLEQLREIVEKHVSGIVEIKENPTYEVRDEIESARGLFVNLLSLGDHIFMPSYGSSEDEISNIDLLQRYSKVHLIKCDSLASFGGLLHCVSFTN